MSRSRRRSLVFALVTLLCLVAGAAALRRATESLKGKVAASLGPGTAIDRLKVGWSSVEISGVALSAPKRWPAAHTLEAEKVTIVPSLSSLFADRFHIASIRIEHPYLSVLRTPGKLTIVPGLLEAARGAEKSVGHGRSGRAVSIGTISLSGGTADIFDYTVGRSPHKIRLEAIAATVRDVAPGTLQKTSFELVAFAPGRTGRGRLRVVGWIAGAGRDSASEIVMRDIDLLNVEPYLARTGEARIARGLLDLNLNSEVRNNYLLGKGNLRIRGLEFAPAQNAFETFLGLPRAALINFLKDHDDTISVDFTLEGDIRRPNFSLNESLATRIAGNLAGQVGVSLRGLAEGVESFGRRGLEGASGAAGAIGSVFRDFFERR
ncbi:MAG TPA: DUF748 domain-containing protein [Candidatus Eisenbacteria bacterium]|nr:DUF748 domain-containing protein [Candidatus Eisenbacteria bacterium]